MSVLWLSHGSFEEASLSHVHKDAVQGPVHVALSGVVVGTHRGDKRRKAVRWAHCFWGEWALEHGQHGGVLSPYVISQRMPTREL